MAEENEWEKEVVNEKRPNFKQKQQCRCDEDKDEFREANKRAKREVGKANESAYKDLYDNSDREKDRQLSTKCLGQEREEQDT